MEDIQGKYKLGSFIKQTRTRAGMSYHNLAKISGLSWASIKDIESGDWSQDINHRKVFAVLKKLVLVEKERKVVVCLFNRLFFPKIIRRRHIKSKPILKNKKIFRLR